MSLASIHKILILRFSSMGDIVMSTPMIRCLRKRFPSAQIDMVVRSDYLDLIRHNPHLDRRVGLDRNLGIPGLLHLVRDLNRERYDLIYDAHRSLRTLAIMPLLYSSHRCYYRKHYIRRSIALTLKLRLLTNAPRMVNKYIEPLKSFGVEFDGKGPEIFLDDGIRTRAHQKFPQLVATGWIGIIPSAQWSGKRWPSSHFKELLQVLLRNTDRGVIVFGGSKDAFCTEICSDFPTNRVINTQGKLSIAESAALIEWCDFVIANDTGLMHVADAMNKPCVLVLGPTSKEMGCLPFHPRSLVVERELWCRPCSKNGQAPCIRVKRVCLETLSPMRVWEAARALIAPHPFSA